MASSEVTWVLLAAAASLLFYCYMKLKSSLHYWQDRGIKCLKPLPVIGNLLPVMKFQKSLGEIYKEAYHKYPNERVVGVYEFFSPVLVIRDPQLIEKIFVKDFQHFTDRTQIVEDTGLFATGLFQMKGSPWRSIRHKISPIFTSGKLKSIFNGMLDCTDEMMKLIEKKNVDKESGLREALGVYTMDVIANTVFGIQIGDKKAKDEFSKNNSEIFNTTPSRFIEFLALLYSPKVASLIGVSFIPKKVEHYFRMLIRTTIDQREKGGFNRNDYTQMLLKLKQQGSIEVQSKDADDEYLDLNGAAPTENVEISEDLLAGQAFQFLSAGFDPLLNSTIYILYDLSINPEIQDRCREHIKSVLEKHKGYTYESLKDMTYLEQCIQETLRFHAITPFLFRECSKKYKLPEENLEIYKGQKVVIPLNAIHMDPKHYDKPEVYNPERLPPNSLKSNYIYMPFGDGPRICIGLRYALVVMKLAAAKLLANYKFTLSPKTKVPFEINKQSILLVPKEELLFKVTKA
ncbi:hypothetical protein O3M35_000422 [Rhynocoris fuscipes]|uniref:Cytochrome P450 n=1 Tax=Rhynocoris fuscipes TaxID=488301 RepID=A0AAW1DSK9_9HEMI